MNFFGSVETTAPAGAAVVAPVAAPAGRTNKLGAASAIFASKAAQKRDRSDSQFEQAQLLATFSKPEGKAGGKVDAAAKAAALASSKAAASSSAGADKSNTSADGKGSKADRLVRQTSQPAELQGTDALVKMVSLDPLTDSSAASGNSNVRQNGAAETTTAEDALKSSSASAAVDMSSVEQAALNLLPFKKRRKTGGTEGSTHSSAESSSRGGGTGLAKSDSVSAIDASMGSIEVTGTRDTDSERESLCTSRSSVAIEDAGGDSCRPAAEAVECMNVAEGGEAVGGTAVDNGNTNDLFIF